jgi:hypothetical protein
MKRLPLAVALCASLCSFVALSQTPVGQTKKSPSGATKPRANWSLIIERNKMDDVPVYFLRNRSSDSLAALIIRCQKETLEIYVATGEYVEPTEGGWAAVRFKFDGGEPEATAWALSSDFKSLFSDSPISSGLAANQSLLARLLTSQKMLFEFTRHASTVKTVSFRLAGLKAAITPKIAAACGTLDPEPEKK